MSGCNGMSTNGTGVEKTPPICPDNFGNRNEGEPVILTEVDFEEALSEAKELVKTVIHQNNTSEARKLKRRLGRMERTWKALMRWIYTVAESSGSEREGEGEEENNQKCSKAKGGIGGKDKIVDPFIKIVLFGLPKHLSPSYVMEEIHRQIDCGQLTIHELSKVFRKYEISLRCPDVEKENWIVKLPRFLGQRMLNVKYVTIQKQDISVCKFTEVIQCYNCWRFGHFAASCRRATRCKVCAGFHHHSKCTEEGWRCVNCTDEGIDEEKTLHAVCANQCPLYSRECQQVKSVDRDNL